jgi:hypothetical protein
MVQEEEPQRHAVVFDVNVYLDVANLLGPPFTWEKFDAAAATVARERVPHPDNPEYDSLRATAACTSGRFAGLETLEVWTNAHIDKTVRGKAQQSITPDPDTGYAGLGWESRDAHGLVTDLIGGLIARSSGGTLGDTYPHGNPPLDHEDGMVSGACRQLVGDDPLCSVYCVTRDKGFLKAYSDGGLDENSRVINPVQLVGLVRGARARYGMSRMGPRP